MVAAVSDCFNPCRVFKSAATTGINRDGVGYIPSSFNPCRVFKSAATSLTCVYARICKPVSIPVGFSSPLQHFLRWYMTLWCLSFNPCRVFKSAATEEREIGVTHRKSFNPCRVFKSAATLNQKQEVAGLAEVSIPVGFSSPLQLAYMLSVYFFIIGRFNPCRVFKSAATSASRRSRKPITHSFNPCRVFKSAAT